MPEWDELWQQFQNAVAGGDANAEERAVTALRVRLRRGEGMPPEVAAKGLQLLKGCRRFDRLVEFSDLVAAFDSDYPVLRKIAAQGLIETAQFDRAIRELEKARAFIADTLAAPGGESAVANATIRLQLRPELAEVEGLLGRVHKQRCVDHAVNGVTPDRVADARTSLGYYWDAYRAAPVQNLWHAVNYVAVARYAKKNLGVDPPGLPPDEVAREILATLDYVETRGPLDAWDHATRAEAWLALGEIEKARAGYETYLAAGLSEFMRQSTRRQLEQIWQLPPSHELVALFDQPLPRARAPKPAAEAGYREVQLEARFKDSPYGRTDDDPTAIERARSVVRLGSQVYVGDGTGFLFNGARIAKKLEGKPLLLTCAHVCPEAVKPDELRIIFFGPGKRRGNIIVEFAELLWTSPSDELDASLLLIDAVPYGVTPAPVARRKVREGDRAYIIGHPLGGAKLASLRENDVREVGETRFYYASATDPGSSGSPVFDDRWQLTGIHRAGNAARQLNEGARLDRVLEALRAHRW